jgi:2'-5' RNA ligase
VDPKNLHLTLKFIGEGADPQGIIKALSEVRGAPVDIALKGLGTFPRVVWIGVEADLSALAARIEQALEPLGIARERRQFSPHLTIARLKDGRMPRFNEHPDFGCFHASEFVLYESKLSPTGPTYTALHRFPMC